MRFAQKFLTALMILSILTVSVPMQKSSGQQSSTVTSTQTITTPIVTTYSETSTVSAEVFPFEGTLTLQPPECSGVIAGPINPAANNVLSVHVSASDGIDFGIISNSTLETINGFFAWYPMADPSIQQALLSYAPSAQASSAQSLWNQEYGGSSGMVPDYNSFLLGALAAGVASGSVNSPAILAGVAWGLSVLTNVTSTTTGGVDPAVWTAIQLALNSSHYFGTDFNAEWLPTNVGGYYLTFMSCHSSQVSGTWEGSLGLPFMVTSTVAVTSTLTTTKLVPVYTEDIALLVLVVVIALSISLALRARSKGKPRQAGQPVKGPSSCIKCGAELPPASDFCNKCGTKQTG